MLRSSRSPHHRLSGRSRRRPVRRVRTPTSRRAAPARKGSAGRCRTTMVNRPRLRVILGLIIALPVSSFVVAFLWDRGCSPSGGISAHARESSPSSFGRLWRMRSRPVRGPTLGPQLLTLVRALGEFGDPLVTQRTTYRGAKPSTAAAERRRRPTPLTYSADLWTRQVRAAIVTVAPAARGQWRDRAVRISARARPNPGRAGLEEAAWLHGLPIRSPESG